MIYKIARIFKSLTDSSQGKILNKSQLDSLPNKLLERRIIIQHDLGLLKLYIVDFPFDFDGFCNLARQIFRVDLENSLQMKLANCEELTSRIFKFLYFFSVDELNHDDLYEVLQNLNYNLSEIKQNLNSLSKVDFLLKNIRDDLDKFLWDKIQGEKQKFKNSTSHAADLVFTDSYEYQKFFQTKIEYEYEIIRTRKVHFIDSNHNNTYLSSLLNKKSKKIHQLKAICADRDIPILAYVIPQTFFDSKLLKVFFCKCEALRELLLSKHFQKFTGYDDLNDDNFSLYFFEWIEGKAIAKILAENALRVSDSTILFRYLAKETLLAFHDLLHISTHSFQFPIGLSNIFYQQSHFRLYLNDIDFGVKRVTIINSDDIVEPKLLYSYGLILISLLAINESSPKSLQELIPFINSLCGSFEEFDQMQKVFDHIFEIEEVLHKSIENETVIAIIIECLLTPYKAKLVFDEFYSKKNFLQESFDSNENNDIIHPKKKISEITGRNSNERTDWTTQPYFKDSTQNPPDNNEERKHKILTIRDLLTHPFYKDLNLDESFLSFLLKGN